MRSTTAFSLAWAARFVSALIHGASSMSCFIAVLMPATISSVSAFAAGAERLLDERLAERFAEFGVGLRDAALPARQLLLLSAERPAEEIEVGVGERTRQHDRRTSLTSCQVR